MIFKYIKAAKFFPDYCPSIKNWKHKLRGKDGNGNPIKFSEEELWIISIGAEYLFNNIIKKNKAREEGNKLFKKLKGNN